MSDPLARLRASNPVPSARVALLEPDPVLLRRIVAGGADHPAPAATRRRRPRGRRLLPALVATTVLCGAVAYTVLRDEVTKPASVACFEQADERSNTEVVAVTGDGALAACAELWRRGVLGTGTDVPPLSECTLPSGVAGVFPVGACAELELPPVPSTTSPPAPAPDPPAPADVPARILAFRDAAVGQFLGSACITPQAGAEIVRRELDRAGLAGWTIVSEGFTADRPCATLSIQADVRQVILVPATPRR